MLVYSYPGGEIGPETSFQAGHVSNILYAGIQRTHGVV